MAKVRYLSDELVKIEDLDIGKEEENPTRKLKLCSCKRFGSTAGDYAVVVEILGKKIGLSTSDSEEDARTFFLQCLDVIPCFWSPKVTSHAKLSEIFDDTVLNKLVELIQEHGNTWSVAHMCVSLPLQEDTMVLLLASDSFKDHFTSNVHPKGYRLFHLAVEQNSLVACKAIMRCSDQWLNMDPGLYAEDADGNTPIGKAVLSQSWACLEYLQQSQLYTQEAETAAKRAKIATVESKFSLGAADVPDLFVRSQQVNDTRLHDLVKKKFTDGLMVEKQRQIVQLLAVEMCDPNGRIAEGVTPLHLAVEGRDMHSIKALIAFGADAQLVNNYGETPLDLAKKFDLQEMYDLLHLSCLSSSSEIGSQCKQSFHLDQNLASSDVVDYQDHVHIGQSPKGDRVLCLDGGGIKGLILIDMLITLERIANKKITELFDWIIGTSTGGILALAMVYTNLTLSEIRRLYFKLKNEVFMQKIGDILLPDSQTEILENILKKEVGEHTKLGAQTHPRVLITTTDMRVTPMKLVIFNNYENGQHGKDQYVWATARATSAAPFYFKQHEHYADGGLKANNPSMSGLTTIHEYYTNAGKRNYKLSVVASLGCGKFYKEMGPLDVEFRRQIPRVVHLNEIPDHLRHLRLIEAYKTVREGYEGIKNLGTPAKGFLFDVLLAEITESDEEPVRCTKALCESRNVCYYRLSPELDLPIQLDESNDEKLIDMLIKTKWYVQANIEWFHRIKERTLL